MAAEDIKSLGEQDLVKAVFMFATCGYWFLFVAQTLDYI